MSEHHLSAEQIRAQLGHPIVDNDAHSIEYYPAVFDYLRDIGGQALIDKFQHWVEKRAFPYATLNEEERRERRSPRPVFWGIPTKNVKDRVSAVAPNLFRSRLDEIGIDVAIVYPTIGGAAGDDDDLRRGVSRAVNALNADLFAAHRDRLIPVAVIPANTPAEAIEELEYAVHTLGFRAVSLQLPQRENAYVKKNWPEAARYARYYDTLALDSDYDYDPLWAKFVELKVAVTVHNGSANIGLRQSWSNHVFNHIGHFAQAGEAFAKALVLGGVTKRFPTLSFGFLEGGVGWGTLLYHDLIGHYEKRNRASLERNNPAHLDVKLQEALLREYGGSLIAGREDSIATGHVNTIWEREQIGASYDDFERSGATSAQELADLANRNFYYGVEADDPTTRYAFLPGHAFDAEFKPLLGSDVGHWDVADYRDVIPEAFALVRQGLVTRDQFRKFTFENAVRLHGSQNPDFFRGTIVEDAVKPILETAAATQLAGV